MSVFRPGRVISIGVMVVVLPGTPVRAQTAPSRARSTEALLRGLTALPLLRPSDETWHLIDRWIPAAADKGHRFGLSDWLIAALANETGGGVWSTDDAFAKLERLKLVTRYDK